MKVLTPNDKYVTFLNNDTGDNRLSNMMVTCINCAHTFKIKKLFTAVKMLNQLGFQYKRNRWVYNNHIVSEHMVDIEELRFKVKFFKKENRDLKRLLKFNKID